MTFADLVQKCRGWVNRYTFTVSEQCLLFLR